MNFLHSQKWRCNNAAVVTAHLNFFRPVITGREAQITKARSNPGYFHAVILRDMRRMAAFTASGCADIRRYRFRRSCGLYSVPAATVHSYQIRTRQRRTVYLPHRSRRTRGTKHPIKDPPKRSNAAETPVNVQKRYIQPISRRETRRRRGYTAQPMPDTATNVETRDISMDTSSRPPLSGSPPSVRKSPKSLIVAKSIVAG